VTELPVVAFQIASGIKANGLIHDVFAFVTILSDTCVASTTAPDVRTTAVSVVSVPA
jgi:hypothetical protein